MSKKLFSEKQKIEICCGLDIIIPALTMGVTPITQFWRQYSWRLGLIFTFAGIALIFKMNTKKYTLAKPGNILTYKRVVIIDSLFTAFGMAFLWMNLYLPDPFSADQFPNPDDGIKIIYPFGALILGALLVIPSLKTNKKILKYLSD